MVVECHQCEVHVDAAELYYLKCRLTPIGPHGRYGIVRCPRCENVILVVQENVGNQVQGDIWADPVRLYPPLATLNVDGPTVIRDTFQEAAACFRTRAYLAAAIMCRKTLEATCALHGVKERNLARSLEDMKAKGLVDARLYEWADELRLAGNEAVHEVGAKVSREDASDMLDFTKAIVDYLFSFRDKFEQFQQRRRKRP
jgi:hypothetical protein